ncbi:MAG: hypothetical protein LIO46_04235 [Clostridiales bacterium]|nr:hypothetical protein [Clostridiales bacterium]
MGSHYQPGKIYTYFPVETCPVCGEKFVPAPEHVYRDKQRQDKLVCSYTCMRKTELGTARRRNGGKRG